MPTIVIFELSGDPLNAVSVNVDNGYTVNITDDDASLEDPDGNGTSQFDVSGIPGLTNSINFQSFETYNATAGGLPVSFTLIQWAGTQYMFVTSGSISVGDTIVGPTQTATVGPSTDYTDLPDYVCFADGTLILTRTGQVAVEDLQVGDEVLTMDNGFQQIRWIGSRALDSIDLTLHPSLKPIKIQAGALGSGLPEQDLVVSQQHRVFVRSVVAQRIFGVSEILIPAKKLLELEGIDIVQNTRSVTYNHFLFEHHEVVFSNGTPTESLFLGKEALKSVGPEALREITALFPEIESDDFIPFSARPTPEKGKMMKQFAHRIQKNKKSVVECPLRVVS